MAIIDNLIFFLELEEQTPSTRLDSHGNNDFTEPGNAVPRGTGILGFGADFESGSTHRLECADNTDIAVTNADFAFVVWVNLESKSGSVDDAIFTKHNGSSGEYFCDHMRVSDRFQWRVCGATGFGSIGTVVASTFGAPSLATWYMLYCEHDATADTIGISVNAGTLDTSAHSLGPFSTNGALKLGSDTFGGVFDGVVDNFSFWKGRKLSGSEITWLYNSGASRSYADIVAGMGGGDVTPSPAAGALVLTGQGVKLGFTINMPDEA